MKSLKYSCHTASRTRTLLNPFAWQSHLFKLYFNFRFPVLIAIDSINSMYTPSTGFGDPDDRSLRPALISPDKLTATRCFKNWKNHGLVRVFTYVHTRSIHAHTYTLKYTPSTGFGGRGPR